MRLVEEQKETMAVDRLRAVSKEVRVKTHRRNFQNDDSLWDLNEFSWTAVLFHTEDRNVRR